METDAASPPHTTTVAYDSLGRRTSINSPDTGLTDYIFDTQGNLAQRVTPRLRAQTAAITNTYDRGRLVRVDYPQLEIGGVWVDQAPTVFEYGSSITGPNNVVGRVERRSDASGETTFRYGSLGETVYTAQALLDPDAARNLTPAYETAYAYDRFGRMRSVTYPNAELVTYRYDGGGSLNRVEYNRGGGIVGAYVQGILYNRFGQRTQITYGNEVVSRFTYDDATRRLSTLGTDNVAEYDGGPRTVALQNTQYSYNANGNISSTHNTSAGVGVGGTPWLWQSYEYDAQDQLRSAFGYHSVPTAAGIQDRLYVSQFQYDSLGRMAETSQRAPVLSSCITSKKGARCGPREPLRSRRQPVARRIALVADSSAGRDRAVARRGHSARRGKPRAARS